MLRSRVPVLAIVGLVALSLTGCAICPKTGKLVPLGGCDDAAADTAGKGQPVVVGGTPAEPIEGAPDAWQAAPGVAVTGQPGADAWAAYSAAGYRTIVSFRPAAEGADRERDMVVANGMRFVNIPVTGPQVCWGDSNALAKLLENPANRPMLLHCSSGNRVAGVWALYQHRHKGLRPEAAIAEGQRVAPMKRPMVDQLEYLLGLRELPPGVDCGCPDKGPTSSTEERSIRR
jgi:protein tyrosine phosphatase (PTP) superfamily phosphohydrolase (DUF442 family)